jgi:subtilase family serine protease
MRSLASAAIAAAFAACAIPANAAVPGRVVIAPGTANVEVTATRAFPATRFTQDLGRVNDGTPMHVVLGLTMRNRALIDTLLRRQSTPSDPLYGHFLTPQQTASIFSPTGAQVQAVASFLARSGFRNLRVSPDNLLLEADGTAATANAAFATPIHALNVAGRRIFANATAPQLPTTLHGMVTAIEGLNNMPMRPAIQYAHRRPLVAAQTGAHLDNTSPPQPCQLAEQSECLLNSYTATGFQLAYDSPQHSGNTNTWGFTGKSTSIAIFAEGDITNVLTDLRTYEKNNVPVLPQVPVSVIYAGVKSPDVSGQDEFDLDTQTSTGMAGNVKRLYIYVATSLTDSDTSVEFDRFKTDDVASAGSASFGECEIFPSLDGAMLLDDTIFAEAAVQGQTVFSSAGDNGTTCPVVAATGVPGTGLPFQSYPGTSPYVVSVGGTTLITNSGTGTYNSEIAWIGTGGGSSTEEASPFWQNGVVPAVDNPPAPVPGVETFKSVPDVAMDADPNTGALVYVNGVATGIGGTSLSSPLSLGVWARLETAHNNSLGFASPLLYQEYKNFTAVVAATGTHTPPTPPAGATTQLIGGFHDIFIGSNGLPALPGYDQTTGLGTFDISLQFKDLPTTYPH